MLKNIIPVKQDLISLLKNSKATILPFIEKPASNKNEESKTGFNATELFSLFTASIIQEEVIFSR